MMTRIHLFQRNHISDSHSFLVSEARLHLHTRRYFVTWDWRSRILNLNVWCFSNGTKEPNPFDDESEEWDDAQYVLTDNGEPGLPVRALYDYEAAEPDELTFKTGEQFEKLEDEDEQGWCKGRKDGRVGLYPANYVETV